MERAKPALYLLLILGLVFTVLIGGYISLYREDPNSPTSAVAGRTASD